ncbi:MAG: heparinase, partial [Pedobacter sp.]
FVDGATGDEGGVSLLRNGKNGTLSTLIFKYASHGLSHGHFDRLNYNLFDKGKEVISDYGSVRYIGVEQKYGGRYLKENDSYAGQTIAHNTLVVDEASHFNGNEKEAEKHHGKKLFSSLTKPSLQVVMAEELNAYKDVAMKRSVYMIELPDGRKLVADLLHAIADKEHQYDLPFQYNGQLISSSAKYTSNLKKQETLGKKNGYQFLWVEAEASAKDTIAQLTFLQHRTFYSVSCLVDGEAQLFYTRTGANDPNFNLRHEPAWIIRRKAVSPSYLNIIEIHGSMDPVTEFATQSYSAVKGLKWIHNDLNYSIAEIMIQDKKLVIAQSNANFSSTATHNQSGFNWVGTYTVWFDGKKL